MIRLATEKSLQSDVKSLKSNDEYAKSWQPLLIMYRSRHEKRLAWKEKSEDFEKIEQALVDQQKELETIEQKLPKPLKIKAKKSKEKARITPSKEAVVYVLDLENRTAEPFGNSTVDEEEVEQPMESEPEPMPPLPPPPSSSSTVMINDPFFLNSQHQITYQKRTTRDKNETNVDDKSFIEHSYFMDALSSSSNRRDGGGKLAQQKWAHLSVPARSSRPTSNKRHNGDSNVSTNKPPPKSQKTNDPPLHPSWEASKQAKSQYSIQKSQAKKIVFNHSDDETS